MLLVHLLRQRVDAVVPAVHIEHTVAVAHGEHIVRGLQGEVLAELIADDSAGKILPGAQHQVGEIGNAAAVDVVLQRFLPVSAAEADREVLLRQDHPRLKPHQVRQADSPRPLPLQYSP